MKISHSTTAITFRMTLILGCLLAFSPSALAGTTIDREEGKPDVLTIKVETPIDLSTSPNIQALLSGDTATQRTAFDTEVSNVINAKLTTSQSLQIDDYCVVHIVRWTGQEVERDGWFLYQATGTSNLVWKRQTEQEGRRIYGSKRVAMLLIHVNIKSGTEFDISYKIAINKKTPAPFKNVMTLIGALSPTGGTAADAPPVHVWGGQLVNVEKLPSDVVVTGHIAVADKQTKEFTRTYDNEGRYHWDVSIGLPVKTFRELEFNAETGRVTTSAKDRQNVYGFLNLYPVAVDTKGDAFLTFPHGIVGLPLASKPLHHPFVGVGSGLYKLPIKLNVFAGVIFHRERVPQTLAEGAAATPAQLEADLRTRWVRKFAWGINIPISQIKDAIK